MSWQTSTAADERENARARRVRQRSADVSCAEADAGSYIGGWSWENGGAGSDNGFSDDAYSSTTPLTSPRRTCRASPRTPTAGIVAPGTLAPSLPPGRGGGASAAETAARHALRGSRGGGASSHGSGGGGGAARPHAAEVAAVTAAARPAVVLGGDLRAAPLSRYQEQLLIACASQSSVSLSPSQHKPAVVVAGGGGGAALPPPFPAAATRFFPPRPDWRDDAPTTAATGGARSRGEVDGDDGGRGSGDAGVGAATDEVWGLEDHPRTCRWRRSCGPPPEDLALCGTPPEDLTTRGPPPEGDDDDDDTNAAAAVTDDAPVEEEEEEAVQNDLFQINPPDGESEAPQQPHRHRPLGSSASGGAGDDAAAGEEDVPGATEREGVGGTVLVEATAASDGEVRGVEARRAADDDSSSRVQKLHAPPSFPVPLALSSDGPRGQEEGSAHAASGGLAADLLSKRLSWESDHSSESPCSLRGVRVAMPSSRSPQPPPPTPPPPAADSGGVARGAGAAGEGGAPSPRRQQHRPRAAAQWTASMRSLFGAEHVVAMAALPAPDALAATVRLTNPLTRLPPDPGSDTLAREERRLHSSWS
jgi:hypothetical protein